MRSTCFAYLLGAPPAGADPLVRSQAQGARCRENNVVFYQPAVTLPHQNLVCVFAGT